MYSLLIFIFKYLFFNKTKLLSSLLFIILAFIYLFIYLFK